MAHTSLNSLFSPRSIAVIGASSTPGKLGHSVLKNLIDARFAGTLSAVNPKPGQILDQPTYTDIAAIPEPPELAVLAVPAAVVNQVAADCASAGVKALVVIAAGFREIGSEGAALEEELVRVCRESGMRLLGPNCLGIISAVSHLNASFAGAMPSAGPVAVISQSGAICTAVLDWAKESQIGFSHFVSVGNKPDVDESDLLEYLAEDDSTTVVLGYLEGIGDGARFRQAAATLSRRKPFILIKSGTSEAGSSAVSSHTGTLTGEDAVLDAVLEESGVLRAHDLEEAFDLVEYFATTSLPTGRRVGVVTNAGGPGVMTTDAISHAGLEMAKFSPKTEQTLAAALPNEANVHNPVDCIGDARAARYQVALSTVMADKGVDVALVLLTPQAMTEIVPTADIIRTTARATDRPVLASFMGGQAVAEGTARLRDARVAVYPTPERAVRTLARVAAYADWRSQPVPKLAKRDVPKAATVTFTELQATGRTAIWGTEAAELLEPYGVKAPAVILAHDQDAAVAAANKIGYPVVMKIDSEDVLHKSDVGGVALDLHDADAVRTAYTQMLKDVKKHIPNARLRGVTIMPVISGGLDFLVGAKRDPIFGPVVAVGSGGIYVEVLADVALSLAPLDAKAAETLINRTKSGQLIHARGQNYDPKPLISAVVAVSRLMVDFPAIRELDLNPFRLSDRGGLTLDTRILLGA